MELFKITCVTCSARLAVRDAALIGHILACPRCGSMVQVAAPTAAPAGPPSRTTPAPAVPALATTVFEVADVGASIEGLDAQAMPAGAAPVAPSVGAPAAPPAATWKLAAIILGGVLAGSAVVAAALAWRSDNAAVDAQASAAAPGPLTAAPASPPKPDPAPAVETPPVVETESPTETTAEPAAAANPDGASPPEVASTTSPPPPPHPPGEAVEAVLPEAAAESAAAAPPPAAATPPRLRIDPLEVDPEGLDLSTLYSGRAAEPEALTQVNDQPAAPVESQAPAAAADEVDAAKVAGAGVRRDVDGAEGPPDNVDALLERRLPAIKFDKMPLCRLVDLAGQLGGVPVSVDPADLQLASVSAAAPTSVDIKNATIEEALATAVKPLRLTPVVENGQLVLRRVGSDKSRKTVCPVDDLAPDAAAVEQLAQWVQQLVAPSMWQAGGGQGRLQIAGNTLELEQREDVTYGTFILLERYRLVRGLPTRTKYPQSLLTGGAACVAIGERLAAPTTFTFSQYTPLREIFRYWQEELEVAVLVDWPALAEERLWPPTRIAASVIDKPWCESLDSVLEPLGLAWRPAGGRTIQITTLAKVRSEPQLELYRLAPAAKATGKALAQQVAQLASTNADPSAATASAYDQAHRILLVRAPASVQRPLAAWLSEQSLLGAE